LPALSLFSVFVGKKLYPQTSHYYYQHPEFDCSGWDSLGGRRRTIGEFFRGFSCFGFVGCTITLEALEALEGALDEEEKPAKVEWRFRDVGA